MFAIPIAVIMGCVYFIIHCADLRYTAVKAREKEKEQQEIQRKQIALAAFEASVIDEDVQFYSEKEARSIGRLGAGDYLREFIGEDDKRWSNFYAHTEGKCGYNGAVLIAIMAKKGKYPRCYLRGCTFYYSDIPPSERSALAEKFMLRVEDEINKNNPGIGASVSVQTVSPYRPEYHKAINGDHVFAEDHFKLKDFVNKFGYGKTVQHATYSWSVVDERYGLLKDI